jgi:hypothetical protein
MRRRTGLLLPLLLALAGAVLIVVGGSLDLDQPGSSLQPIPDPTSPVAIVSHPIQPTASAGESATPVPTPSPTPIPDDWVAVQLQIETVGINVRVKQAHTKAECDFPDDDAAYVLCGGAQPGRNNNTYIFAHAILELFKPLWNVQIGAEVRVLMSDGAVLRYVVTEVRPNVSCPDNREPVPGGLPLALKYASPWPACDGQVWTQPTDHERLTLQTSQGFNRNYGELVVIAEPLRAG